MNTPGAPDHQRTALIVHAHPEPASFSSAQMREAQTALRGQGYQVRTIDLYRHNWAPVLDRAEFPTAGDHFKPQAAQLAAARHGTLAPDVRDHLHALLDADLLVLSFPLWWFSVPAILKGWIDRTFVMGEVFGGDHGLFGEAALAGRRAVLLITTGGSTESFGPDRRFGDLNTLLFHVHHGMLRFVGYDVLEPVVTYGPAHLDDSQRHTALSAAREAFEHLDTRATLTFDTEQPASA